ncbi:MAG: DUF58 domain-containing protein [Candidatus Limnocylindria bacterium]
MIAAFRRRRAHAATRHEGARRGVPEAVLRKIKQVEIKARVLADDALLATYRSVFRGSGLDFEEVREYEPGDEIRAIDWNVTARMGTPYIKKYREERRLNIFLAVDVTASSHFGTVELSKRDLAADVAALLAVAALRNNDRIGLLLFADGVRDYVPPREGREHLLRVVSQLLFAEARRARSDVGAAAQFLGNVTKKRSVVFVLSDFLDAGFEAPLRRLGQKHDVIALTLNDPREQELPAVGVIGLEDAETGRTRYIDTGDAAAREEYAQAARQRRAERRRSFARIAVDSADLHTDRSYVPALMALFNARTRRN